MGINNVGLIQYADIVYYSDGGHSVNDNLASYIAGAMTTLYNKARWNIKGYSVTTDKPSNTWCRAPGKDTFTKWHSIDFSGFSQT